MGKPVIAIIGRPNVGKSTLFNRLVGGRRAIVDDRPGVTRDRHYGETTWGGRTLVLVDTGGFDPDARGGLVAQVREQARRALAEADLVFLVVDAKEGLTPADAEVARILRREARMPAVLVVNKVDAGGQEPASAEFYRLGCQQLFPISAEGGRGIGDLMDAAVALLPEAAEAEEEAEVTTVAVVGRQNVGKSSLVNRILGEERVLVSPEPGTTRDAIDTHCTVGGRRYCLIDTAGIRAKGRTGRSLERYAVSRALAAVRRCDVALVLLDGVEGPTVQDTKVAGAAHEAGCGAILVVNKWDLVTGDRATAEAFARTLRERFKYLDYAPILTISALTGLRVLRLFPLIDAVQRERRRRIPTPELNRLVEEAVAKISPPAHRGRPVKIRYATQAETRPPTFVFFVNEAGGLHFSYQRYLANRIREAYGFMGTPIRLIFRGRR